MANRIITLTIQTVIEAETEEEYREKADAMILELEKKYDCVDVDNEEDGEDEE